MRPGGSGRAEGKAGAFDGGRPAAARPRGSSDPTRLVARILDVAVVASGLVALALSIAGARAPHYVAAIAPAAMSSDGGRAYVFSPGFAPRWPYAVPSHPGSVLAPADVAVLEDGRPIGALDPSHADIRDAGGGLHNLWDGSLWFSPSDDTDPRTNGRAYRLVVKGRLSPSASAVRFWAVPVAIVLLLARVVLSVGLGPVRRCRRLADRVRWAARSAIARRVAPVAAYIRAIAGRIPLTFGRTYALASSAVLLGFAWQTWTRPARFVTQADSFGYIFPGLLWASGADVAGQSSRDIGYPALTVLAIRLGSLAALPRIQLVLVVLGMACLLGSLYLASAAAARRLKQVAAVPRSLSAAAAAAAAVAFVALLASHDLFVIDIESAMAEAPHVLPTALASLLFLNAWVTRSGRLSVALMASATLAAYGSALFKPHTLIVFALCAASLLYKGLRHGRELRSPGLLAFCAVALVAAVGLHRIDVKMTPPGADFGTRTLFCNRLDVILPVFDASTPARLHVAGMMGDVMRDVDGWPLMGYSGDRCVYNSDMQKAIAAAADEEGFTSARWMQHEFITAVLKNPLRYTYDIWKQAVHFFQVPITDADIVVSSDLSRDDEARYAAYAPLINMPRDAWNVKAGNWVPAAYPRTAGLLKGAMVRIAGSFSWITLGATGSALLVLAVFGRRLDCRLEMIVVATGAFTAAFIGTVLLSHSFDIGRYATDILPISLLWWFIGAAYLVHVAALALASLFRDGTA